MSKPHADRSDGDLWATTKLCAEASSAGAARRFVTDVLVNRGMEDELADVAALLTSELVTNAVLHARSDVVLEVLFRSPCVRIQVRDASAEPALQRVGRPSGAVPGRGLELVDALAHKWGSHADGGGKCVWFELRSPHEAGTELRHVALIGVPAATYIALNLHIDQVLHELQLATAAGTWTQTAHSRRLHRLITRSLDSQTEARASAWAQAQRAMTGPAARVDIDLRVPVTAADASRGLLELLEEADTLSARGELLTPPPTPEVTELRRWVIAEMWLQLRLGREPQACPL